MLRWFAILISGLCAVWVLHNEEFAVAVLCLGPFAVLVVIALLIAVLRESVGRNWPRVSQSQLLNCGIRTGLFCIAIPILCFEELGLPQTVFVSVTSGTVGLLLGDWMVRWRLSDPTP